MTTVCIAGRNEIAVNALRYLKKHFPDFNYCIIPCKSDYGITDWQPSLVFVANKIGVRKVALSDVYNIEDLIFISLQFDRLVDPSLFKSKSIFNIHFSALPKFKGMYTSIHPILQSEKSTGVTLHKIDSGIDTGEIIDQIIFSIDVNLTGRELYLLYLDYSFLLFKKNIESLLTNDFKAIKQNWVDSSYYSKKTIDFSDLKIDLNKTAYEIYNQYRAFNFREYQLPQFNRWSIYKTEITETRSSTKPGTLLFEDNRYFLISTIDYNIRLYKDYYDVFWDFCKNGDYEKVVSVIDCIPDVNLRNKNGWNGLILSVYNNHLRIAKFLMDYPAQIKADINSSNYKGTTVAMYAWSCYKNTGDDSMLRFVASKSPDLNRVDENNLMFTDFVGSDEAVLKLFSFS